MKGRCKDCYFWEQKKPLEWQYGRLQHIEHTGECSCPKFIAAAEDRLFCNLDEFLMFDDMGLNVAFYPCSFFGCIHFRARS